MAKKTNNEPRLHIYFRSKYIISFALSNEPRLITVHPLEQELDTIPEFRNANFIGAESTSVGNRTPLYPHQTSSEMPGSITNRDIFSISGKCSFLKVSILAFIHHI
jgi:hypothetical protein